MSFRIERGEAIPDALRRIAAEEIDGAQADRSDANRAVAVHSIRKRFKRLRALLRLVADDVPNAREYDGVLRLAARTLSMARDQHVARDTARRLAEHGGDGAPALKRFAEALAERTVGEPDIGAALDALSEPLREMRSEVARWTVGVAVDASSARAALSPALRKTYRLGRRRYAEAHTWPTAEHLHEWRKRVKDLWYQVSLLEGVEEGLRPLVADLDDLGDALGLDHDLAVLHGLAAWPSLCPDADRGLVHAALAAERERLHAVAWPLAARLYALEPDAFVAALSSPPAP